MLTKSLLSTIDDVGVVYFSEDKVFRGVYDEKKKDVIDLLSSGLIQKLVDKKLFPETKICNDQEINGFDFVLEHEKINPIIYPHEWSPEMLRRAGLVVLEVNKIANDYGYEIKDSHVYNLVYRHSQPVFVDFGSFVKKGASFKWAAYERFVCAYIFPLKLYKMGCSDIFKNLFLVSGKGISSKEFWLIKNPTLRCLSGHFLEKILKAILLFKNIETIPQGRLENKFKYKFIAVLINKLTSAKFLAFTKINTIKLKKQLESIRLSNKTEWGTYHERVGMYDQTGEVKLSNRMKKIIEIIASLQINSVTELAGNQGALSRRIAQLKNVNSVICADYDENAIDRLLLNLQKNETVTPMVLDFMRAPILGRGLPSNIRLASDLVVALAVTHHLILRQSYSLDAIFTSIFKYAKKYVLIEFMPLGLYSQRQNTYPSIPDWYTEDWFKESLIKFGKIIERNFLEKNRILYLVDLQP